MAARRHGVAPKIKVVTIRCRQSLLDLIDRLRGDVPRSRYIETLIIKEAKRRGDREVGE